LLTERKHIALLGVAASLAFPAVASAAGHEHLVPGQGHLQPRVRLHADVIGIGDAKSLGGPLLDPVQRFSALIATTTQRTEHRHKVKARKRHEAKEAREEEEQFANLPGGISIGTLEAIASCESGGNPEAVSPEGTYMGLYQFDQGTWESVGGSGSPIEAPAAEQTYRAALLYSRSGSSPWPVCGQ
jgi:hypothetical protein